MNENQSKKREMQRTEQVGLFHLASLAPAVTRAQVRAPNRRLPAVGHPAPLAPPVRGTKEPVPSALVAAGLRATTPSTMRDAEPSVALRQLVAPRVLALSRRTPVVPAKGRASVGQVDAAGGTAGSGCTDVGGRGGGGR